MRPRTPRNSAIAATPCWRVDSTAYLWHAGRIDTLPQAWDDGIQIPGQPSFWFRGTSTKQLYWWNGERASLFPETIQGIRDWRSHGDRLLWLQTGNGCSIHLLDRGEDRLLEAVSGFCASQVRGPRGSRALATCETSCCMKTA